MTRRHASLCLRITCTHTANTFERCLLVQEVDASTSEHDGTYTYVTWLFELYWASIFEVQLIFTTRCHARVVDLHFLGDEVAAVQRTKSWCQWFHGLVP